MNLLIFAGDMKVSITQEHESDMISKPVIEFEPTGLFQPERNTRISAVATLEDRLTDNGFS
ncbi:hypothetical protein [Paenibacillus macquariensis]|nr:hypothetical protein [Paenibacillus macquariensis]MEC0093222.1 hypothetical protein [Paenibacillus macquariensis]